MGKTIVLFPEAAFGPALNCVGIAQKLKQEGHNPVFICDKGFKGVFQKYGFEENLVDMSGGMSDEEVAKFWADFIAGHRPHFRLAPIEQLPSYGIPGWEASGGSAIIARLVNARARASWAMSSASQGLRVRCRQYRYSSGRSGS